MYPDSGTIEMRGRVSSLIELGAGFHPDMSGRENIYINASIFGLTKKEIDNRLDDIIAFSELEEFIDNPVRTYSSGMYMRLAFSVAINVDADILLIDEILAVGDANFQAKCFNRLREIKSEGVTIVIVSHSLVQIEQICEKSIWINDGTIVAEGIPYDVHPQYLRYMENKRLGISEKEEAQKVEINTSVDEQPSSDEKLKDSSSEKVGEDKNVEGKKDLDRWGKGDAYFKSIKMLNKDGVAQNIFSTEDKIVFSIDIGVKKKVESAVVGIGIVRNDGTYCYGTNTQIDKYGEYSLVSDCNIKLEVPSIELLPAQYYIDFEIKDKFGNVMEYYRKALKLDIVSVISDVGIFRIKHSWKV